jgi:nucleoside-diphosphate-sugar epimerase
VLGTALLPLFGDDRARAIDRRDGLELSDRARVREALYGCDMVIHLAALHPLVAPEGTDASTYHKANVVPFQDLLTEAQRAGVRRVVLASSTSVWRDAEIGEPARFLDESVAPDADDGYARSKRECEAMLRQSRMEGVILRLARFARAGDVEDEVRKLYRAVDPRDAAAAVALAARSAPAGALYALSAPTPFTPDDAALLASDPREAVRRRLGRDPAWVPERIGSVVVSTRATRELGWRAAHPSALMDRSG